MQAWVRYVGVAVFALHSVACSDKGDSDPAEGSGATGAGGSGSGASGGSSGTGNTAPPVAQYNFDADEEGWAVLTGEGASKPETLQETTTVEPAADEGSPDPGSLKVTVPFDGADQSVGIVIMPTDPNSEMWDYTGKKLSFKVKLASGLTQDAMNPGGVRAFAKGGPDWAWASGTWTNAGIDEAGSWLTPTLDFTNPSESKEGYNPAEIRQIGIQILTGGTGEMYEPAVVYVDTATVQ